MHQNGTIEEEEGEEKDGGGDDGGGGGIYKDILDASLRRDPNTCDDEDESIITMILNIYDRQQYIEDTYEEEVSILEREVLENKLEYINYLMMGHYRDKVVKDLTTQLLQDLDHAIKDYINNNNNNTGDMEDYNDDDDDHPPPHHHNHEEKDEEEKMEVHIDNPMHDVITYLMSVSFSHNKDAWLDPMEIISAAHDDDDDGNLPYEGHVRALPKMVHRQGRELKLLKLEEYYEPGRYYSVANERQRQVQHDSLTASDKVQHYGKIDVHVQKLVDDSLSVNPPHDKWKPDKRIRHLSLLFTIENSNQLGFSNGLHFLLLLKKACSTNVTAADGVKVTEGRKSHIGRDGVDVDRCATPNHLRKLQSEPNEANVDDEKEKVRDRPMMLEGNMANARRQRSDRTVRDRLIVDDHRTVKDLVLGQLLEHDEVEKLEPVIGRGKARGCPFPPSVIWYFSIFCFRWNRHMTRAAAGNTSAPPEVFRFDIYCVKLETSVVLNILAPQNENK
ncbi:hypothetical protein Pmar_PMAR007743 [Perkinsus marinus ATCC 50983]|uniref:Uncharacterized protein n=1 Tax=Perkinsus marinus (strain ATCC 50983 / TXsc) TaxID=423536 RepID=C5LTM2_PERM5|nr:hypothetical protein Pmar_PMAR007743 [Perkinsus marinus ATCC 50983]EEQ99921.1 hypothetical protein Pmar_PMAR007743 [Perkinsus marinus ATCC 50983]|eukprot:XP_002767204.1 hypothetical protein Pmar_PMAR007743 [Perkinsus marinus ATCC 50983]